jgi:hypothetical protein
MLLTNTGTITNRLINITLYKLIGLPQRLSLRNLVDKLREKRVHPKMERPLAGFIELALAEKRQEVLGRYVVETRESRKTTMFEKGVLTTTETIVFVPRIADIHLRIKSGLIEVYGGEKRCVTKFVADLIECTELELTCEKIWFSEKYMESILSRNEDLFRVKLDGMEHTYLKEVVLKGDMLDASEEFKHYRTDKGGKLRELHLKLYTPFGKLISLVIARDGRLRIYQRGEDELDWEDLETMIDEIEKYRF